MINYYILHSKDDVEGTGLTVYIYYSARVHNHTIFIGSDSKGRQHRATPKAKFNIFLYYRQKKNL